jgi:hypothetical protein
MDDCKQEKSAIEKMVDRINDAVESIVNTASEAAMKAMEPESPKTAEQPIASLPLAGDGLVSDPFLTTLPVAPAPAARKRAVSKKAAKKSAKKSAGKTAKKAPKRSAANKPNKRSKKSSKKSAKRSAKKVAKKKNAKMAVRKSAKKAGKRKARKSKR